MMVTCKACGETKWGNKFPETDSVCLCDEDDVIQYLLKEIKKNEITQ